MATKTTKNAVPVFPVELPTFDPEPPTTMEGNGQCTIDKAEPTTTEPTTEVAMPEPKAEKLTGEALLAYATAQKPLGLTQAELAFGAGYVTRSRADGTLSAAPRAYSSALAVAAGLVPAQTPVGGGRGRPLTFKVSSNAKNGNIQIPGNYLVELGVSWGAKFAIIVDREAGELVLQKLEAPEAPAEGV